MSYHSYRIVTKTASIFPLCSLDRAKSKLPSLSPSGGKHKAKDTRISFLCWDHDSKVRKDSWNSYSFVLIALWWSQWNLLLPKKPAELTTSWTFFASVQGFPFNSGVISNLQKPTFPMYGPESIYIACDRKILTNLSGFFFFGVFQNMG